MNSLRFLNLPPTIDQNTGNDEHKENERNISKKTSDWKNTKFVCFIRLKNQPPDTGGYKTISSLFFNSKSLAFDTEILFLLT